MKYAALLRGINVGGNNKIDMKQLIVAMEKADFKSVSTYINTGNIFFEDNSTKPAELTKKLEQVIHDEFGLAIKVLLRDEVNIRNLISEIPDSWENGSEMKCDVMFLWNEINDKTILDKVAIKPGIDTVRHVEGALIWKVDLDKATRSGMQKLPGTKIYASMTVRNCNTARKIHERLISL